MRFKRLLIAAGLVLAASSAWAQAQFPAGTVWGNATASQRPGKAETVTSILDRALGSTRGAIIERGASGWGIIGPGVTAGLPYITGGTGADGAYGVLGIVGGGTGANVKQTAFNNLAPTPTRAGDIAYYNGTNWVSLAGNNSGTRLLQQDASGVPSWIVAGSITTAGNGLILSGGGTTLTVEQLTPGGRLTLTSATPVMATSATAATTLYYAPFIHKYVPVYTSGTGMRLLPITSSDTDAVGLSIVLGASWATNSNYDAYAYVNGASAGLCTSPDWSAGAVAGSNAVGASTRGTGAGSAQQQLFKGVRTNQNTMTCRTGNAATISCAINECTYLGTMRTGAAGQVSFTYGTVGTAGTFNLWNAYNQQTMCSTSADANLSWLYGLATPRQANASSVNQFNFVAGLASGSIDASYSLIARPAAVLNALAYVGIAINSITTVDKVLQMNNPTAAVYNSAPTVTNTYAGRLGANYIAAIEYGDGVNGTDYFGQGFMSLRACVSM